MQKQEINVPARLEGESEEHYCRRASRTPYGAYVKITVRKALVTQMLLVLLPLDLIIFWFQTKEMSPLSSVVILGIFNCLGILWAMFTSGKEEIRRLFALQYWEQRNSQRTFPVHQ